MERFYRGVRNPKPQTFKPLYLYIPDLYHIKPYLSNHYIKVWALYMLTHGLSSPKTI